MALNTITRKILTVKRIFIQKIIIKQFKLDFFLWTNALFGKENDVAAITSQSVNVDEALCFEFWFDLTVNTHIMQRKIFKLKKL